MYVTGHTNNPTTGMSNFLTVKYDPSGNVIWHKIYESAFPGFAADIAVDEDGNIYVVGNYRDGTNDIFLTVKYDPSGEVLWAKTYENGDMTREVRGVAVDKSGNVYVVGKEILHIPPYYYNRVMTMKYDSAGNLH
jgi:hypothetical protein